MTTHCSTARLKLALAGDLPVDDEAALQQHLEECDECGAALEQMAGGAAWCEQAAALLTADELDASAAMRDPWSAVDFTVEHLEPADEPNLLGRLGGYDILEIIGRGGMGVVLNAYDRELKRCVAIKVLAPHLAQSSLAKKRFAREAQAAAAVMHPNVLAIHQVQPGGRLPFLVMPLVAGESLAERLAVQGTLDLKETLRIGMQAAAGLAAAHEQGLVHRDVKPANILLEKGVERAVLTDFGLARAADDVALTRWGVIAGTPQYMSPEQVRGEPLDGRSDLFSLGCVLYEMASGVSPFRTDSMVATMRRLVDEAPQSLASRNPELPPWFIAIVDRLLQKDPSLRFDSAQEASELLEGCLAHVQQPASVPLPAQVRSAVVSRNSWLSVFCKRRNQGVVAMLAAFALTVLGALFLSAEPPDIAGLWSGDQWGRVELKKTGDGEYAGTYTDTFGQQPGELHLKWSRIEQQFNGTWREGDDRFGEISLRLVDNGILGAHTTDAKSKINPATPRLAGLAWTRAKQVQAAKPAERNELDVAAATSKATFGPVIERLIPFGAPCRAKYFQFRTGDVLEIGTGPGDTSDHAEEWRKIEESGGVDAMAVGGPQGIQFAGEGCIFSKSSADKWGTITADEVLKTLRRQSWITGVIEGKPGDSPLTYLFKTAGGEYGVLQIYEVAQDKRGENELGMKIRYKLVDQPRLFQTKLSVNRPVNPLSEISVRGNVRVDASEPQTTANWLNFLPPYPLRDVTGKLQTLFRHDTEHRIAVVAFSPDGKTLAIGGDPREVVLLDAQSGRSFAGLKVLTDTEVVVLAAAKVELNQAEVRAIAFSPDAGRVAVGTSIGQVKVFDVAKGELFALDDVVRNRENEGPLAKQLELRLAQGNVWRVAFSPDGSLLATCGDAINYVPGFRSRLGRGPTDGLLKLWDAKTGKLKQHLDGEHSSQVVDVAFSPDGKSLASAGHWPTGSGVKLWDPQAGNVTKVIEIPQGNMGGGSPLCLGYSPDGKRMAMGLMLYDKANDITSGSIHVVYPASGVREMSWLVPHSFRPVAFSPDGKTIAAISDKNVLSLWDASTGNLAQEFKLTDRPQGQRLEWFAFSPTGNAMAVVGMDVEHGGFVEVWSLDAPLRKR